jgi:hypothetical protein
MIDHGLATVGFEALDAAASPSGTSRAAFSDEP